MQVCLCDFCWMCQIGIQFENVLGVDCFQIVLVLDLFEVGGFNVWCEVCVYWDGCNFFFQWFCVCLCVQGYYGVLQVFQIVQCVIEYCGIECVDVFVDYGVVFKLFGLFNCCLDLCWVCFGEIDDIVYDVVVDVDQFGGGDIYVEVVQGFVWVMQQVKFMVILVDVYCVVEYYLWFMVECIYVVVL